MEIEDALKQWEETIEQAEVLRNALKLMMYNKEDYLVELFSFAELGQLCVFLEELQFKAELIEKIRCIWLNASKDCARKLIDSGMEYEKIAYITRLTDETVKELANGGGK